MLDHIIQILSWSEVTLRLIANLNDLLSRCHLEILVEVHSLLYFEVALLLDRGLIFLLRVSCLKEVVELKIQRCIVDDIDESSCLFDQKVLGHGLEALLDRTSRRLGHRHRCKEGSAFVTALLIIVLIVQSSGVKVNFVGIEINANI